MGPSMRKSAPALQFFEEPLGETAARHVARVQLEKFSIMRRICDGEAPAAAILQKHIQVLTRLKVSDSTDGSRRNTCMTSAARWVHARDTAGQRLDLNIRDCGDEPHIDGEVRKRARLT